MCAAVLGDTERPMGTFVALSVVLVGSIIESDVRQQSASVLLPVSTNTQNQMQGIEEASESLRERTKPIDSRGCPMS